MLNPTRQNLLSLIDEIRGLATEGLLFSVTSYDKERYSRLVEIAANLLSIYTRIPAKDASRRFMQDLGVATPKLGADAAILDDRDNMLLIRRSDDGLWSLPGGWVKVQEDPKEAVKREVYEETGIRVSIRSLIAVNFRPPSSDSAHASVHLLYLCKIEDGKLTLSEEATAIEFASADDPRPMHKDHAAWCQQARLFQKEN